MRIAILGIKSLPAYAGADRVVEQLLDHLPPEHDVTVYLTRSHPAPPPSSNRRYVRIAALNGKHAHAFSYFLLSTLHFVLRGNAEVVHVQHSDFGLFCPLLKLKRGVRVVGTFHGNPYEREKWGRLAKAYLRVSEWVFVHCCDELTSVAATKSVPGRTVTHVPNGVQVWSPKAGPDAFPYERLGLRKDGYLMFACGRLDSTKGLHHLLRAYRDVAGELPLLVVGDFSHDVEYSAEIEREAGRDRRVILLRELLDRETLFEVVANSNVFVFPSDVEAMSMMLLEAVACRKITVCSDIPENIAVVEEGYPFLFKSGDPESLAEVLVQALRADAPARVEAALDDVARRFRWPAITQQYLDVLRPERTAAVGGNS